MRHPNGDFIQFLGTGGGDFSSTEDPEADRDYLPRVRELGGRNLRWAAQAFVSPDILIDFFDDRQIKRFDVPRESIRHVLVTHCHYDHLNPVGLIELAANQPHPLDVYGTQLVGDSLEFHAAHRWDAKSCRFRTHETKRNWRFHQVGPQQSLQVGDATVAAVQANHSINKGVTHVPFFPLEHLALNYVIERGGKTIFYGLDSSYTLPSTLEYLRRYRLDVAVLDVTFGQMEIDPAKSGHHNFTMIEETIRELRDAGIITDETTIIASHMAVSYTKPHDDLVDEARERGISLAYDGMVLES